MLALAVLAAGALASAGCGDDTPAVCGSLGEMSPDVDLLEEHGAGVTSNAGENDR